MSRRRGTVRPLPVMTFLRQRRRRRIGWSVALVILIAMLAVADRRGWLLYDGGDVGRYHDRWFDVVEVLDGHTLMIRAKDAADHVTRVRLWGIDPPPPPDAETGAAPAATPARLALAELADGHRVYLQLEPHHTRASDGALMAFVQRSDGRVINEQLIAAGLVRLDRRYSHQHMERYERLADQARHDGAGLWGR